MTVEYKIGDCLGVLKDYPDDHFDSCVTDPPYFLIDDSGKGFMGKEWESFSKGKAIQLLCKSNEFAQYVIEFLRLMQVERSGVEGSIALENVNTNPTEGLSASPSNSNAKCVESPSVDAPLRSRESTKSVQGSVFTKDALLESLKELSISPTTAIENLSEDVLFVIPSSHLQRRLRDSVPADVLKSPIRNECGEPTILLTLMAVQRLSAVTEAMIGRILGFRSIGEITTPAVSAESTVDKRRYKLTTSASSESQETIRWLIWLLFASSVIPRSKRTQRDMKNALNQQSVYAFHKVWAQEVYRVLKPGAHILSFGGTRTYHRMVCALEDVGFETRDSMVFWCFGSGFPKSLDVSKAIDKHLGADREVTGKRKVSNSDLGQASGWNYLDTSSGEYNYTKASTSEAKQWQGWGTALKPAYEPIVLARKPLEGTVAQNVLKYGTGGINVDGCRIEVEDRQEYDFNRRGFHERADLSSRPYEGGWKPGVVKVGEILGRWPSNLLLDEESAKMLDEQSGYLPSGARPNSYGKVYQKDSAQVYRKYATVPYFNPLMDSGGASRFFYIAKASRGEREKGLARLPEGEIAYAEYREEFDTTKSYVSLYPDGSARPMNKPKNVHPTVKPVELMRYLVRLVTPKDGLCLDPFLGSGTTLLACRLEGFNGLGIEKEADYEPIIRERLAYIPPALESFEIEQKQPGGMEASDD